MSSNLVRFLLSLVIRLRRSFGHIAIALQARFTALWRHILTFASHRPQRQIALRANDVPVVDKNPTPGESAKVPKSVVVPAEQEHLGTLAAQPVLGIAHRDNTLSDYQTRFSDFTSNSEPKATTPERGSQRYKRRKGTSPHSDRLDIPAGQQTLVSALKRPPEGWIRHVHPEGNPYYYHKGLRIFTEADITDETCETSVLFHASKLIQKAQDPQWAGKVTLDELTEIVLNVDDTQQWHYYFVDHKNRLLFWLQSMNLLTDLGTDVQGVREYSHIRYLVEAQYWYASSISVQGTSHCEFYPHDRILPPRVFEDLRGMLLYAKTDMMTADSSTSLFTQDELVTTLGLIDPLKGDAISNPYSIWVIARLMMFLTENQFLNFCGQSCARLNADTPLFGDPTWHRTKTFIAVSAFLFGSANDHAVRLQRVWVDGIIILPRWKDFVSRLTAELGRYTIFFTVMLAVNFSFLAVPGVVTAGTPANATQIIIYCSIVSTIGSIVFSFALLNVYSDPELMAARLAADVMRTLGQTKWGMACLAVTHSLPIASLVWSIVLFATALAVQIFSPKQRSAIATLTIECFILVLLGIMGTAVMGLFSRRDDAGGTDGSGENPTLPVKSLDNAERGEGK